MPTQAVYTQPIFLYTGAVNQCIGCIGCIGPQITSSRAYPVQIALTLNHGPNPNPSYNPNPIPQPTHNVWYDASDASDELIKRMSPMH